jgi:ankyrin repeat protein
VQGSKIHAAVRNNNFEKFQDLLHGNPTCVNAPNEAGDFPLHLAASLGYLNILRHLIMDGAKINSENADGRKPMHMAAAKGQVAAMKILAALGGNVTARTVEQ